MTHLRFVNKHISTFYMRVSAAYLSLVDVGPSGPQDGEEEMSRHSKRAWMAAVTISAAVTTGIAVAPMASASPVANSLIAQDSTPAPLAPSTLVVGVDADMPSGLTVRGAAGKPVSVQAVGEKARTAIAPRSGAAVVFTKLTAGKVYTVSIAGKRIGTATPVATPSPAWGLTVSTTEQAGSVALVWKHQLTKAQGKISYQVTATPRGLDGRSLPSTKAVTATSPAMSWTLEGLDPTALYTFTVTPANSAATGKSSTAVMSRTLGEIFGTDKVASDPVPAPAPTPAPAPSAPAPAAASVPAAPATRTIYVCPDGYTEAAGLCTKTLSYTYTKAAYTYHQEAYQVSVQDPATVYAADKAMSTGTLCPWGGSPNAGGDLCSIPGGTHSETRYNTVKDAAPNGYTDDGTQWVKKDTTPAGYTDTGTQWISTVAKVAQIVPA